MIIYRIFFIFFVVTQFCVGEESSVVDIFLRQESQDLEKLGPKHPKRILLDKIKQNKTKQEALELIGRYLMEENSSLKKSQAELNKRIKFYEIKISPSQENVPKEKLIRAKRSLLVFLNKLLEKGVIVSVQSVNDGYNIVIKKESYVELSRLRFATGYIYDLRLDKYYFKK